MSKKILVLGLVTVALLWIGDVYAKRKKNNKAPEPEGPVVEITEAEAEEWLSLYGAQ